MHHGQSEIQATGSCEAAGFFLQVGATAVPFYILFLSFYFLKKVKYKMTLKGFSDKYEFKIHALKWLFPIFGGVVALTRNDFNPAEAGALCMSIEHPYNCQKDPDLYCQCTRGQNSPMDSTVIFGAPIGLAFFMLVWNFVQLTFYVYSEEKLIHASHQYRGESISANRTRTMRWWDKCKPWHVAKKLWHVAKKLQLTPVDMR